MVSWFRGQDSACARRVLKHYGGMKLFAGIARSIGALLGGKDKQSASKSKLVGLYLTQANGKDGPTSEFYQTRQRRNGKYSHNRERA